MRAAQVPEPGEGFELVERDRPTPGPEEVLVAVAACGVCRGDTAVTEGRPPVEYPRVPGHEVAGTVEAVGADVTEWAPGDRVAVGWHGGHCFTCGPCRRGDFVNCESERVTGVLGDGGYAEFVTVPWEAPAPVPEGLDLVDAAPLVCAGLTAFSALRSAGVGPGDTVAVQGVGGVGHMGLAFADAAGAEVVALSRSPEKAEPARELGADAFVDTTERDPEAALQERGGADVVLGTAPSAEAMAAVVPGLAPNGELVAVGAPEADVPVPVGRMLGSRWAVRGWSAGHAGDAADALAAAARNDLTPEVERYPLAEVETAMDRTLSGAVRFRAALEP